MENLEQKIVIKYPEKTKLIFVFNEDYGVYDKDYKKNIEKEIKQFHSNSLVLFGEITVTVVDND